MGRISYLFGKMEMHFWHKSYDKFWKIYDLWHKYIEDDEMDMNSFFWWLEKILFLDSSFWSWQRANRKNKYG